MNQKQLRGKTMAAVDTSERVNEEGEEEKPSPLFSSITSSNMCVCTVPVTVDD